MNNIAFARNLVKGKIAETLFAQMLREAGNFTVLEFGYEKLLPELVQNGYQGETLDVLRTSPDFAVIDRRSREVKLIEVKYLHVLNHEYVLRYAKRMAESWNPSYLFLATQSGFFFDDVSNIVKNDGKIETLHDSFVHKDTQQSYLKILVDFEANN